MKAFCVDRRAGLAAAVDALEAVLGQRLPGGDGADVDVLLRRSGELIIDRAEPHARLVGLRPAAAEEVRPAHRAERLGRALLRLVRAQELLAREDRDLVAADAAVRRADAAGELLARRAVTERPRLERVGHLEQDSPALAASAQRHGSSLHGRF